ncbi:sigma-54 dependent transcriptional regulator [Sphingomonas sp. PL-96]|uniref:sigma-54-dependent transcriptional regulator n=1 Tax=Sphingomonas sp. PL-96 TaxID=2887201 RepID=UPI001E5E1257|nr:sigma-54 dependent transcriptional regulator [Sphingomonas sp. PL-96]MCC2976567.1 sigma-54 dependent transcriptional regulator [Sphingomonas sp. PL-96]
MNDASAPQVALVDDDEDVRAAITQTLQLSGYAVRSFASGGEALAALDASFPGVLVSDVRMPHLSGIGLFQAVRALDPELPVILVTGHGDVPMAVDALKAGAWDFLTKPFDPDALLASVARAAEKRALVLENRRLRALVQAPSASPLIGDAPAIVRLRAIIETLAATNIDVLIEGETGTGKELIARLIHQQSAQAKRAFVTVPCAAIPDAIADVALHGDIRPGQDGAEGRLMQANQGSLFLDDVDQAGPALQAHLVRFLEDRLVQARGARAAQRLSVRVIGCMSDGGDAGVQPPLLYRLAAIRLRVPPLRERKGDIPQLFAHLLDSMASRLRRPLPTLDAGILQYLVAHDWPGNVHELGRFAERLVLKLDQHVADGDGPPAALGDQVDAFERNVIVQAVRACGGDIGKAIARLGLTRNTFYYKVHRHGIDLKALRKGGTLAFRD